METDFIYKLNDDELRELKDLINQEYGKREKNKREEAKEKIFQLISEIDTLCLNYNLDLFYDGNEFDSSVLYFDY